MFASVRLMAVSAIALVAAALATTAGAASASATSDLSVTGPAGVLAPGTSFELTGTLTADGQPLENQQIDWTYHCEDVSHVPTDGDPDGGRDVRTDAEGDFTVHIDRVACHTAEFSFSHPYSGGTEGVGPRYVVVTTSYDTAEISGQYTDPPWEYVGDEIIANYTYTVDGVPQQNAVVIVDETQPDKQVTLPPDQTTTDDQGKFTVHLTKSAEGPYTLYAHVPADGNTLAAGEAYWSHAMTARTYLNATITGANVPGYPRTIAGTLSRGDINGGATVHLRAYDMAGGSDRLQDAVTAEDGSFSFTDTPLLPGATRYELTYDGDGSRYYESSWLSGVDENLIVPDPYVYAGGPYEQSEPIFVVAVMAGGTDPNALITVTREAADGSGTPTVLFSDVWDNMPPAGVRPTEPLTENTTFTISTPATVSQEGATASVTAYVAFGVHAKALRSWHIGPNGTAVYRHGDKPVIRADVAPGRDGVCVHFDLARKVSSGLWRQIQHTGCHHTNDNGRAIWRFNDRQRPGSYRVAAQAKGDSLNLTASASLVLFRVRPK